MTKEHFLLILLLINASCATRRFPGESVREVRSTVTVYRDTTIYIRLPGDTVFLASGVGEGDVSRLITGLAVSEAWVEEGMLKHRLLQKDTLVSGIVKNAVRSTSSRVTEQRVEQQAPGKEKHPFWKAFSDNFKVIMAVILILTVVTFLKSLKSLFK